LAQSDNSISSDLNTIAYKVAIPHGKRTAIVGAGIAGIATSIRLARKGHQVDVFEANDYPGGKLTEIKIGAYRFDAGPSLFTLPTLVDELFEICNEDPREYFNYKQLDILCNYFYEDGTMVSAHSDRQRLINEFSKVFKESPDSIQRLLDRSSMLHQYLGELFMERSIHDPRTFFNKTAYKAYSRIHRFDFFRSMHRSNQAVVKNPKLVQLMDRYATYNGSDPYQTPGTMNIIPHLEHGIGGFFPEKGMHDITKSLYELAKRQGVKFHFGQKVSEILVQTGKIKGLKIENQEVAYDRVISNMDLVGTYKHLLPSVKPPKRLLTQPKSSSALIFYWGIKKSFPQLNLHNILFSNDYKAEFEHIFKKKTIYEDPTVYINITSKYKPDDAPKGSENWFTMINVPNNQGQDWDALITNAKENIIRKIGRMLGVSFHELIQVEEVLEPRTIESRTSSSFGALYGNSSNNMFSAFLRHANFSKRVAGLYFCGGSVHPGGGIPMCLSSAKIVDRYFQ
jgi:phytoene desaturase